MLSPTNRRPSQVKPGTYGRRPAGSLEPSKLDYWPQKPRFRIGFIGILAIVSAIAAAGTLIWVALLLMEQLQAPPTALRNAVAQLNRLAKQQTAAPTPAPAPPTVAAPAPTPPPTPVPVQARVVAPPPSGQAPNQPPGIVGAKLPPPQLVITQTEPSKPDTARALNVAFSRAVEGASLLVGGLTPGATVSTGRQAAGNWWRLSPSELETAAVTPPPGFAGTMDLLLELRLSDNTVADRKSVRLEWQARAPAEPAVAERHIDPAEIAALIERGRQFITNGDLAAARALFQRAAEGKDAQAAFALAETYDPNVLRRWGELGFAPDVAMARTWYGRAKDWGSKEAADRLQILASGDH
jgi:hypothetical protein